MSSDETSVDPTPEELQEEILLDFKSAGEAFYQNISTRYAETLFYGQYIGQ